MTPKYGFRLGELGSHSSSCDASQWEGAMGQGSSCAYPDGNTPQKEHRATGQTAGTWPYHAAREPGKCSNRLLDMCSAKIEKSYY